MTTYIFKTHFNLHTSGQLYIPGLDKVIFEINQELTETQINAIKTKISQFFTNKLGLNVEINLDQVIK